METKSVQTSFSIIASTQPQASFPGPFSPPTQPGNEAMIVSVARSTLYLTVDTRNP